MPISYKVTVPIQAEPITLSDAKAWLRIDFSDDDATITEVISDARRYGENLLKRSLATQTIQEIWEFDHVPAGPISGPVDVGYDTWRLAERPDIPLFGNALVRLQCHMGPVQSLTSVEYQLTRMDVPEWTLLTTPDGSGNDTYRLDSYADTNEINIFTILAATRFRLTYVAGYTTLPPDIRRALLRLIAWWYQNREGEQPPANIDELFVGKRVFML
ncbi:MAG: head-tail connector protein [Ktedonobacteraceae bacterium]